MIIREFDVEDLNKGILDTLKEVWFIDEISNETLISFLKNDNHMIVCEKDNKIISTATLHLQKKLIRNGGIAGFIEDVVVKEEYRNMGIGYEMVNHLIEMAKKLNCYKVILSCFPERINFYKKCGFFEESTTMRINL
jgi:glucosamine-phosphate N-acetyltransferase